MADRPIPFSGPMIDALLAGRKTQTRRVLKPQPPEWATFCQQPTMLNVLHQWVTSGLWRWSEPEQTPPRPLRAWPVDAEGQHYWMRLLYAVGDRLWVRETYFQLGHWEPVEGVVTRKGGRQKWRFVPDSDEVRFEPPAGYRKGRHAADPATTAWHQRLGRFMPRAASRLTLTVTDVRAQRLFDITEDDAKSEGCWTEDAISSTALREQVVLTAVHPSMVFRLLWNDIHGPDAWAGNPWVTAVSFTVDRRNIDAE